MDSIYEKYKDEDGFLYIIYQDMEDKGGYWSYNLVLSYF